MVESIRRQLTVRVTISWFCHQGQFKVISVPLVRTIERCHIWGGHGHSLQHETSINRSKRETFLQLIILWFASLEPTEPHPSSQQPEHQEAQEYLQLKRIYKRKTIGSVKVSRRPMKSLFKKLLYPVSQMYKQLSLRKWLLVPISMRCKARISVKPQGRHFISISQWPHLCIRLDYQGPPQVIPKGKALVQARTATLQIWPQLLIQLVIRWRMKTSEKKWLT